MTRWGQESVEKLEDRALLSPQPFARWEFNENSGSVAADSVGNSSGTISGASWTHGASEAGLSFDGANDSVTFGTAPSLSGETDFTVSAWIRTTSTADGVVIQQRNGGFNGEYVLKLHADGRVNFFVYGNGTFQYSFSTSATVNDGRWHHLTAMRSGTGGSIFIDGVQRASATGTIVDLDSSIGVGVGADIRDNNQYFNGRIDDVRIYDQALSPAEISEIAQRVFVVNDNGDGVDASVGDGFPLDSNGRTTLRAAIEEANTLLGVERITFNTSMISGGTIPIGLQLTITNDLEIVGPGSGLLTLDAQDNSRGFQITKGDTASIQGLTINDGNASALGGGIYNQGVLTLNDVVISSSRATNGGGGIASVGTLTATGVTVTGNSTSGIGGGILNQPELGSTVSLHLESSTVDNNVAGNGGGILNWNAYAAIVNSTISTNMVTSGPGGALSSLADGASGNAHAILANVTVTKNVSTFGAIYAGSQRSGASSIVEIANSIIIDNTASFGVNSSNLGSGTPDGSPAPTVTSLGNNLASGDGFNFLTASGDQRNVSVAVVESTLADNGGPTLTHALVANSLAIDAGNNSRAAGPGVDRSLTNTADNVPLTADQRGLPYVRRFNGTVDIGALEFVEFPDYGDAPDTTAGTGRGNYQTRASDGGPSHGIVDGLRLGAAVDGVGEGELQNASAKADDAHNALPDDEDGVQSFLDLEFDDLEQRSGHIWRRNFWLERGP